MLKVHLLLLVVKPNFMNLICRPICSQLLVGVHIGTISISVNIEFKLMVMCSVYNILSSKFTLKNCKSRSYCNLDDRADFYSVYHVLHLILMSIINIPLKLIVKNACRSVILLYQM